MWSVPPKPWGRCSLWPCGIEYMFYAIDQMAVRHRKTHSAFFCASQWIIIQAIFYWKQHILELTLSAIGVRLKQRDFADCLQCPSPVLLVISNEFPYRESTTKPKLQTNTGHCVFQASTRTLPQWSERLATHRLSSQPRKGLVLTRNKVLSQLAIGPTTFAKASRLLGKDLLAIFGRLRFGKSRSL